MLLPTHLNPVLLHLSTELQLLCELLLCVGFSSEDIDDKLFSTISENTVYKSHNTHHVPVAVVVCRIFGEGQKIEDFGWPSAIGPEHDHRVNGKGGDNADEIWKIRPDRQTVWLSDAER